MVHPSKFSTEMDPLAPRSDMPCTLFTMMSSEYDGKKEAKEAKEDKAPKNTDVSMESDTAGNGTACKKNVAQTMSWETKGSPRWPG